MRYHELTILTDLDGTLIPPSMIIPPRNLEALRAFTEAGGRFALATGRTVDWIETIIGGLPVNFPCILYNGGVIYDAAKKKILSKLYLPAIAREHVVLITERMPWAGVVPISDGPLFCADDERIMVEYIRDGKPPYVPPVGWRENKEPWLKVLFAVYPERSAEFMQLIRSMTFEGVRIVQTSDCLIEMLPEGSSKGAALQRMYETLGLEREKTVAIGDFYNDYEMIRAAGIGACVAEAPPELREASRYITCPCGQGALADLIEHLRRDYPA